MNLCLRLARAAILPGHPLWLTSGKKGAGNKPHKISDFAGAPVSGSRSKLRDEGQASQLPNTMSLRGVLPYCHCHCEAQSAEAIW